jgi:hypothetical protein
MKLSVTRPYTCIYSNVSISYSYAMTARWENITVSRQQLSQHNPSAIKTHETIELLLNYHNGNGIFYVVRVEML